MTTKHPELRPQVPIPDPGGRRLGGVLEKNFVAARQAWKERLDDCRNKHDQIVLLTDMVLAHVSPESYEKNVFGKCSQLLTDAKDPRLAVTLLWESMGDVNRKGDPVRYAYGKFKDRSKKAAVNGGGMTESPKDTLRRLQASGAYQQMLDRTRTA